ncbi:hypothetical protein Tco_1228021 [Tanacetum coccineum]
MCSQYPPHAGVKVGNDSQPNKAFLNGVMNKDAAKSSFASVLNVGRNPKPIMDLPSPVFSNEGFDKVNLRVFGFGSLALPFKKLCVVTKTHTIINDMIKVLLKGCVLWLRVKELEARSPDFSNDDSDNSSSDEESVNEEHDNGVELKKHGTSNAPRPIFEDPFGIYDLLNKNAAKQDSKGDDPIFPPGFTPDAINDTEVENMDDSVNKHIGNSFSNKEDSYSAKGGSNRPFKLKSGGSILDVMEGLVEVGQTMGFNMEGCLKNIEAIISAQGDCQETKVEMIDLFLLKENLWGNFSYDYDYSPSIGYSGGLLCIWDPNMFSKDSMTISDSFVAIRVGWRIVMEETLLKLDPETIQERFGSNFNASGANAFNQFISSAGLVDLPLEDLLMEKGMGNKDLVNERNVLIKDLQDINSCYALDMAQKAKIHWAIEECRIGSTVSYEEIKKRLIIDQDVVNAVQEFSVSSKFPPGCNSSFITLIPKKQDAKGCFNSAMGSILDIGCPTSEFKFHKGLFKGIRINDSLTLSHLIYADDAVFIGKSNLVGLLLKRCCCVAEKTELLLKKDRV